MNYDPTYWENLRANDGDIPHQIDKDRFWYLLEVLFPADWTRGHHMECFRVPECQTSNLYTWCVRLGVEPDCEYWEMIAPQDFTPANLLARIETARRVASV